MRILLSAFACEPAQGSEPGIGWSIAWSLAQQHHVHVITTPRHRPAIQRFLAETPCGTLSFSYFDLDERWLRTVRTSTLWQIYYHVWQLRVAGWAAPVVAVFEPDLIHHVTYGRYWSPSSLWKLQRPFIWGPVGGGDTTPAAFVRGYSARGRRMEKLRRLARYLGEHEPGVRATARHAAFAFATTPETAMRMEKLGVARLALSSHAALARSELPTRASERPAQKVRFACVGNLLHWKGFHLGIEAFAAATLPQAELIIAGDGPERAHLERLAARRGIADRVTFAGRLQRSAVLELMDTCTALLHPSLHDSGGFVCLEAMAHGRPVVCLNLGGPGLMVTAETGFSVAAGQSSEAAVADLAGALQRLATDRALGRSMGEAGHERVAESFLWEKKTLQFEGIYRDVLGKPGVAVAVATNGRPSGFEPRPSVR